jgi:hypothetical protein
VSFSDKRVADLVNSKFIAAWTNRGPGFNNTEYWTEKGIAEQNYEAYPTKNICTFFLTPQGKVFYYVAGSYSPELLLKILESASALRKLLFDEKMVLKDGGLAQAATFHEDKTELYDGLKEQAQRPDGWQSLVQGWRPGSYRGFKHTHGASCGWSLKNGYEYLAGLHRDWSLKTELPAFDDVRYRYLYGNDFTEETADSSHVSRPEPPEAPKPVVKRPKAVRVDAQGPRDLFGIGLPGFSLIGSNKQ